MMCCQDTKTTVSNYTIKIEEFYPSTKKLKKKKEFTLVIWRRHQTSDSENLDVIY